MEAVLWGKAVRIFIIKKHFKSFGFDRIQGCQTAFHDEFSNKGVEDQIMFDDLPQQFGPKGKAGFSIGLFDSAIESRIRLGAGGADRRGIAIKNRSQSGGRLHGVADPFKGAGADKGSGFADQVDAVSTGHKITHLSWPCGQTGFRTEGFERGKGKTLPDPLFLLFERGSCPSSGKTTAINKKPIFTNNPGAAFTRFFVKEATVVGTGHILRQRKPLLDGLIFHDPLAEERAPDKGRSAVCSDKEAAIEKR